MTGLAELVLLGLKKLLLHRNVFLSPHVVWMAPLVDVFLSVAVALILVAAAHHWSDAVGVRVATFAFISLGVLTQLLKYPDLHWAAALALTAGVAVQGSRLATRHAARLHSLARRTTGGLALLVALLAVGMFIRRAVVERRATEGLPTAAPAAPSVLLIVLDTVRAQNLSVYGYGRPTSPALEELARTGVRFESALSTAPWTTPSHRSLFTGLFPFQFKGGGARPSPQRTLAEVLGAHGYLTAGFVANVELCGAETGLARGFAHYEDYRLSLGEILLSSSLSESIVNNRWIRRLAGSYDNLGRKRAADLTGNVLDWLSEQDSHRPFFVFVNYFDAHEPYLPPHPFSNRFGSPAPRRNSLTWHHRHNGSRLEKEKMSAREIQAEMGAYDASIAYLDHELGALLDALRARGSLENTLVVVTADHGEQFGEHGLFTHKNSLYRQLLQVPLLISFPGRVPAGPVVREPVTLRDVPATVLDLVGVTAGALPGTSLAHHWNDPPDTGGHPLDSPLISEWETSRSIVAEGHHLIRGRHGSVELYDFDDDPLETRDVAASLEGRPVSIQLQASLEQIVRPAEPVDEGDPDPDLR